MEKDIEDLQAIVNNCNRYINKNEDFTYCLNESNIKALDRLIQGYRKLEKSLYQHDEIIARLEEENTKKR